MLIELIIESSTSTTFRHPEPEDEREGELHPKADQGFSEGDEPPFDPQNPDRHIYSRYSQPVLTRTEKVLSALLVCYISHQSVLSAY